MAGLIPTYEEADIIRPGGRPIPEALEPRMGTYYIHRGDLRLRVMFASAPIDEPRGSIIFSPGRTEFIEKYLETAAQGLSDRLLEDKMKSYVDSFQDYADDLAFAAGEFSSLLPKPHIVMGHSMGGTIALQTVLSGAMSPSAVICSAPMLGLYDLDTPIMKWVIRGLAAIGLKAKNLPFQSQRNGLPVPFNTNKLTSDKDRYRHWAAYFQTSPRLRVGQPTFVAAGADPIVDPASNENFASKARATFKVVPGALHELFLERDIYRDQFFAAFDQFLKDEAL